MSLFVCGASLNMRRYVFYAGIMEMHVIGESIRQEIWMGIEADEDVDLHKFSMENGFHLIPAESFKPEELASIGVTTFRRLEDIDASEPS